MQKIRVMVVDDSRLFCDLIQSTLLKASHDGLSYSIEVMKCVYEVREAIKYLERCEVRPDVVLMDICIGKDSEPNGLDATKRITDNYPLSKVIILSLYHEEDFVKQAFRNGARGYFLKADKEGLTELGGAIAQVWEDGLYLSSRIQACMVDIMKKTGDPVNRYGLTGKQLEVARLYAIEKNAYEIAEKLRNAKKTIEKHITDVRDKLNASSSREVKQRLMESGLLPPDSTV